MVKNVVIAGFDDSFKKKLIHSLSIKGNYKMIACADNGYSLLQQFARVEYKTHIVITDLFLEGISGIEVLQLLRQDNKKVKLVAYSSIFQKDIFPLLQKINTEVYCPKEEGLIVESLDKISETDQKINMCLTGWYERKKVGSLIGNNVKMTLSGIELKIIELVCTGKTNKEIAVCLSAGLRTIDSHLTKVLAKLSLKHRIELACFAYENGICSLNCSIYKAGNCCTDSIFK